MNQRKLENGVDERDALDGESRKVAALLSALPRVEAPKDFEFRVRARIAEGIAPRASLMPFLKIAAPLSLVLVVVAFLIFYSTRPTQNEVVSVSEAIPSAPSVGQSQAEAATTEPTAVSGPQIGEPIGGQTERETERSGPVRRRNNSAPANRSQGGSVDRTLESANMIMPPGFESANPGSRNLNANVGGTGVPVRDVLDTLGVSGDFLNGGWKVRSVAPNSLAQRAGVRSGDVIEAIDGQPLMESTSFRGRFSPKTLRIRRNDNTLTLKLTN